MDNDFLSQPAESRDDDLTPEQARAVFGSDATAGESDDTPTGASDSPAEDDERSVLGTVGHVVEEVVHAVEDAVESVAHTVGDALHHDAPAKDAVAEGSTVDESPDEAIGDDSPEEIASEPSLGDAELVDVVEVEAAESAEVSPYERPGGWYVVHTYAGYENKVKKNLGNRIRSMNVEDRIFEIVIPMEDVIEFKGGRKVVVQKKVFPGYLLVRMELDDDSWYVVRNTEGVTGFVGSGSKPSPLSRKEVENILGVGEKDEAQVERKARPRLEFEVGEQVRVTDGPFDEFNGSIAEIDVDRSKLKVLVNIFGREPPVELEFGQVAKL